MTHYDDAVWKVWRSGRNPDRIDVERIAVDEADGFEADEIVERELRRIDDERRM